MALIPGFSINGNALHVTRSYSEDDADAFARAQDDAGSREFSGGCLDGRVFDLRGRTTDQPSILIVPQLTRNGVAYNQLPNTRTNFIQNSAMLGATGSVLPTTWSIVAPPSGITVTYSSAGVTTASDGTSVDYIDVTVSGTALASGNFNLRPEPVSSTVSGNLLFAAGITYTASFYMALLSGSVSGISPNYQIQEVSGTTFVAGTSLDLSAITSSLTRYSVTRQMVGTGGADRVRTRYGHAIASGQVLDYTIRIASPQLEKGSVATRLIRTATQFLTAALENGLTVLRAGAPPDFTVIRNTTATRVNSSGLIESVASGVPRIDWFGQSCPGLLVEASAQNLVPNGVVFNSATGVQTSSVTDSPAAAISGTLCTKNEASGTIRYVNQTFSASALASVTTYTVSRFFKYNGVDFTTTLEFNNSLQWGGVSWSQGIVLSAASGVTLGTSTSCTGSVENFGNGWYRVNVRVTTGAVIGGAATVAILSQLPAALSTGQGFLTACPQLETGSIPTSYIPTTTGSATRNADVCSVTGVSGYIGQTEGTIYAEVDVRNFTQTDRPIIQLFLDSNNRILLEAFFFSPTFGVKGSVITSGSSVANITFGITNSGIYKIALAYKQNDFAFFVNGTLRGTDTLGNLPSSLNAVHLGHNNGSSQLSNYIRSAALYTTRLSNDQLQSLTRLT